MKYKDGVVRRGLHWRMRKVEKEVDKLWSEYGQDAVMTAGLDGDHSTWSWHYYGCAADFRTNYFADDIAEAVATELQDRLGAPYQVVYHEGSHVHVEFDPVAFDMDT